MEGVWSNGKCHDTWSPLCNVLSVEEKANYRATLRTVKDKILSELKKWPIKSLSFKEIDDILFIIYIIHTGIFLVHVAMFSLELLT